MSNSSVQAWTNAQALAATSSKAFVNVPTAGNLIVAVGSATNTTVTLTMSDDMTDGGTWSAAIVPTSNGSVPEKTAIFWKQVGASANSNKTPKLTQSSGTQALTIFITEISSTVGGTWALDGTPVGTTGSTANPVAGSIVTTDSNPYLVGACAFGATAATAGTGFTRQSTNTTNSALMVEDQFAVASGSYSVAMTHVAAAWLAIGAAWKNTGGGGGGTTGWGQFIAGIRNNPVLRF